MKLHRIVLLVSVLFASEAFAANLTCVGTEPFWGVTVDGNTLTYSTPDHPNGEKLAIGSIRTADGMPEGSTTVFRTKACIFRRTTTLTVIRASGCSDGMSDATYSHYVVYDIEGHVLAGCCNEQ
ncbi:MAG: hypothetical protein JST04_03555 [Bdellovibrionales bacterium]|nr:hypothetical protein [Bdellovibrionales bacterium]